MDGIFKKDNVYVCVTGDVRDDIDEENMNSLIYTQESQYNKRYVLLYGGRVSINYSSNSYVNFIIDGIIIQEISSDTGAFEFSFVGYLSLVKATAFLNQIENLGVDTFLDNYKKRLIDFKTELEEKVEKMEQEQSVNYSEKKKHILILLEV